MTYRISEKANSDLENIWDYTYKNWSPEQADRYIRFIISKFLDISQNPDLGKSYEGVRKTYRGFQIKSIC